MSTDLATQSQLQEVILSGSEILQTSAIRVDKALAVGENIVKAIQEQGMNAELDERANKFLVNCRTAKNDIETQRKPITSFFDQIRKQFTETEGKLDPKKADTVVFKIQGHRDAYVKKLRDEETEKQRIAQLKIDKENEIIDIKSSLETQLSEYVQNHVLERKQKLQNSFNNITLETFIEKSKALKTLAVTYSRQHFDLFSPNYLRKYTTQEETAVLLDEFIKSKDFDLISAVVVGEIQKFKLELIEKLPSLKTSLDEMAKAGEEEKKRLQAEKEKREADAEAKMKADAEAKTKADAEALELQKVADQTNAMMNNMVLTDSVAPETRDGYKITLLNKTAVAEIFTFWFQREGMTLTLEELEKKSIAQMKAYCEKVGHKSNDVIVSVNLKYEPVYKAVNRK
jgi:hypothetical protein